MALLPIHKYFISNGTLKAVSSFIPSENEGGIYEVLRVDQCVPLFLEDHLIRFYKSAEIEGKEILYSSIEIGSFLNLLIQKEGVDGGNILLSCKRKLKAFFIAHKYPDADDYRLGVKCGLLHAERTNPNAKVFQTTVRERANQLIEENAFYEVLLIDNKSQITEGSRSNVFLIKGHKIFTPPAKQVLLGITRQKTIQCANELGFELQESEIKDHDLAGFDAAFITGTSPKILPVNQIEELCFNTENEVLRKLMARFDLLAKDYIREHVSKE
jgi:branched-chain amino acid aminotransferase